jgi:DNA-binding XRE family transcriptional regulator
VTDARDHAVAMREVAAGAMELLSEAELDAYLAAPTPLAFWRRRRGLTQAALGAEVGASQPFLAQIEAGRREGGVHLYARLAEALTARLRSHGVGSRLRLGWARRWSIRRIAPRVTIASETSGSAS